MTYILVAEITAKEGCEERYWALLREIIIDLSADPCFVEFSVHRSPDRPTQFLLYERWTSREGYERVREGERFRTYVDRRAELVAGATRSEWSLQEDFRWSSR